MNRTQTSLAAVGGVAFLLFVWPTPFEYTRQAPNVWRVNRFTGVKERATDSGWRSEGVLARERALKLAAFEAKQRDEENAIRRELTKVVFKDGTPTSIENPTEWSLSHDDRVEAYEASFSSAVPRLLYKAKAYNDDIEPNATTLLPMFDSDFERTIDEVGRALAAKAEVQIVYRASVHGAKKQGQSFYLDPPVVIEKMTKYEITPPSR